MFLFLGLSAGWSVVGCAAIESLDTTSESFNVVRLSGRSNRLSPLCNSESGLIRNESFNKESPGNTIFFNESVASESVTRLSFGAAIVSVASGVFLGAGFGRSILNCTGTEYLQRTRMPCSRAGIQLGILRIAVRAAESISARRLRTTVGEVIRPSFSTTNCTATTPSRFSFLLVADKPAFVSDN